LRVTLATTSLSWSYFPNAQPMGQVAIANATGTYNGTIYVGAVVENSGATNAINPDIPMTITNTQVTATVTPAASLPVGTYTGRILFLACSDQACNNRIGGTPLTLPFAVTVKAPIQANPATVNASATSGSTVSQSIAIQPGAGESGYTAVTSGATAGFIQIASQTATGFTLNLASLPAGTYSATVNLTGSQGSTASLPVNYTVAVPAGGQHPLSVSPMSLTFSTTEGATSAAQTLTVTQPSWQPGLKTPVINYTGPSGWLSVVPEAGGYRVSASASALSAGSYSAMITIDTNLLPDNIINPFGVGSQTVNVALTVGAGLVRPADVARVAGSEDDTAQELAGTVPINIAGGPVATWNAVSSNPAMLTVTPSGPTGSNLTYNINAGWLLTATNYQEYTATISLSVPGSPITGTQFVIKVTPQFATVQGVGPRRVLAGQNAQLVVSGRGFAAISNPAARLSIPGVTITQVQRVNDQKLLVDINGLTAGSYAVSVGNALNRPVTSESFRVFSTTTPSYATAITNGYLQMLAVDDERGVVYGLKSGGTLLRFQPSGGGWTVDPVPGLSDVTNFGLMADGSLLATTGTPSNTPATLRILNGNTLQQTSQVVYQRGIGALNWTRPGLPVGADGKVWLRLTGVCYSELGYYDPADAAVHVLPVSSSSPCPYLDGPEFAIARNGERMVLWPHAFVNEDPKPMLYMDTSDRVLHVGNSRTSANIGGWGISAYSNNDGSRTLYDMYYVLDEVQNRVGNLEVPDYGPAIPQAPAAQGAAKIAAIISPDGTRAYVLTYRNGDISQPSQLKPRVYVFNTAVAVGNNPLPLLGYFELDHYPSCHVFQGGCDTRPPAAISMDGRTLYFGGSDLLVVKPIPLENLLTPAAATGPRPAKAAVRTQVWQVSVDQPGAAAAR
jgi:hypothetical protein